jgi:ABC-2 type transport system ATP-binding protein
MPIVEPATQHSAQDPQLVQSVPTVIVRDVEKSFPITLNALAWIRYRGSVPRRKVLFGVSFEVRSGQLFGLLGPNGAGKTTLLKLLATLCIPDHGQIYINGLDAGRNPILVKQHIGLCTSEERSFYFRLTARANLRFFGTLMGLHGKRLEKRIEEVAGLLDLRFALDRRFDTFSSGMRQRLALARAILADPPIILLDEPTRAVDPLHAHEIRRLIRHELVERRGKTAVLATNILEEAWALCDQVAVVHDGRIVALGPPKALNAKIAHTSRLRVTYKVCPDTVPARLRAIPGVRLAWLQQDLDSESLLVEYDTEATRVRDLLTALLATESTILAIKSEDPQPLEVYLGLTQNVDAR